MSYLALRYCCECKFEDKGLSHGCCCWCHELDADQPQERVVRDPNRIPLFIERLKKCWEDNPDLRIGQLVANGTKDPQTLFYLEDEELMKSIEDVHSHPFIYPDGEVSIDCRYFIRGRGKPKPYPLEDE